MLKDILSRPDVLQQAIESLQHDVAQLFQQLQMLASLKDTLRKLHENIYQLRDDQAASVEKLLTDAGKLTAPAAEQWVNHTFNAE